LDHAGNLGTEKNKEEEGQWKRQNVVVFAHINKNNITKCNLHPE
jgi:hypothetical protein